MPVGLIRGAVVGVVLSFIALLGFQALAAASNSKASLASFLTQAKHGVSGTFYEIYDVSGPVSGTVKVAQQDPSGDLPSSTGRGRWSFLFEATSGDSAQWIEHGPRAWDCLRRPGSIEWTCSGPGTFQHSNGFALAITPYIPMMVLSQITAADADLKPKELETARFNSIASAQFGVLECMTIVGLTSCLDRDGVLVSQHGGTYWTNISLELRSSSIPRSAFTLEGKSTSSGREFELLGNS